VVGRSLSAALGSDNAVPATDQTVKVLLAASQGGHLQELITLRSRVVPGGGGAIWLTSNPTQVRSAVAGDEVVLVRHAGQRDVVNVLADLLPSIRALWSYRPMAVVSTGAAIALAVFPAARLCGIETHYVESAARTNGPSLTGRILRWLPGTHCYTQWEMSARRGWDFAGSVFDGFVAEPAARATSVRRVVVTLGTQQRYGFTRLIMKLLEVVPRSAEVFWQVRRQDAVDLGLVAHCRVPATELAQEIQKADVVVAHAGIGSALMALEAGKCPVLVPRERRYGEHVDDHQALIGRQLSSGGLAVVRTVEQLRFADLDMAARQHVRSTGAPALDLRGHLGQRLSRDQTP